MERGTAREREALRDRWDAMERQRRVATRLGIYLCLLVAGIVPLLLAVASGQEICLAARGLPGVECDGVVPRAVSGPLVAVGVLSIGAGLWGCRTCLRE